jgi:hypothetical protein
MGSFRKGTSGFILFGLGSKMASFGNSIPRPRDGTGIPLGPRSRPVPPPHIKSVAPIPFGRIIRASLDGVEHDRQCRGRSLHRRRMALRRIAGRRSHCRGPAGSR